MKNSNALRWLARLRDDGTVERKLQMRRLINVVRNGHPVKEWSEWEDVPTIQTPMPEWIDPDAKLFEPKEEEK